MVLPGRESAEPRRLLQDQYLSRRARTAAVLSPGPRTLDRRTRKATSQLNSVRHRARQPRWYRAGMRGDAEFGAAIAAFVLERHLWSENACEFYACHVLIAPQFIKIETPKAAPRKCLPG